MIQAIREAGKGLTANRKFWMVNVWTAIIVLLFLIGKLTEAGLLSILPWLLGGYLAANVFQKVGEKYVGNGNKQGGSAS